MTSWIADSSLRIDSQRRTLLGGSPLKFMRLSESGMRLLRRELDRRRPVPSTTPQSDRTSSAESELLDRLVDAGMIHPLPAPGRSGFGHKDVTVVVPVKDDSERLRRLLDSLSATCPDVRRVVIVDDGSESAVIAADLAPHVGDRTADISFVDHQTVANSTVIGKAGDGESAPDQAVKQTSLVLEVLRLERSRGPAAARNAGAKLVDTALVAFVDADCVLMPVWLDRLIDHFAHPNVDAVAPRIKPAEASGEDHGYDALARYESTHSPLDLGSEPARVRPLTRVSYVPTAAMVVRAEAFRTLGEFDESLRFGEDVDFVWRMLEAGSMVRFEPLSVVEHDSRTSLRSWVLQRYSYGTSAAPLAMRHGDKLAPVVISRWSAVVWGLALAGRFSTAVGVAGITLVLMRRKLSGVALRDVTRIVIGGHLGAGGQLARSLVRVWWPLALIGALLSRRLRTALLIAIAYAIIERRPHSGNEAALGVLDDLAYGTGVWAGCLRERSLRAVLPSIR